MKDYSQPGDLYGISEYTAQSAETDLERTERKPSGDRDRNTAFVRVFYCFLVLL